MFDLQSYRVQCILLTFLLFWLCVGMSAAWADSWASPTTQEYRSSNDKYVARVVPAWAERRDLAPTVTVFEDNTEAGQQRWTATLSNNVSPVEAIVSDDGKFVVTLDNWHRVGYGEDVVAFYGKGGQIKKYSLEAITGDIAEGLGAGRFYQRFDHSVSSRWWRGRSLMFFDGAGDSTSFGIWLNWAKQWFVWRLSDGSRVQLAGDVLKYWNEKGRRWARGQLQLPEVGGKPPYEVMKKWNEEAQAWSRRKSARYGKKLTACRYLALLKNPDDRPLLEQALLSTERNSEMELRTTADRALAIHDGVAEDFQSLRRMRLDDRPQYYLLGAIELKIRLPEQPEDKGQVYVSIFPETVKPEGWRTAQAEHRTGKSFTSSSAKAENGVLELSMRPVRPGKYWVKAIWDKVGPHEYNLFWYEDMREWRNLTGTAPAAGEGDFETEGAEVFEVKAGETTVGTLDCSHPGAED